MVVSAIGMFSNNAQYIMLLIGERLLWPITLLSHLFKFVICRQEFTV